MTRRQQIMTRESSQEEYDDETETENDYDDEQEK